MTQYTERRILVIHCGDPLKGDGWTQQKQDDK